MSNIADIYYEINDNKQLNHYELYEKLKMKYNKNDVEFVMYDLYKYTHSTINTTETRTEQDKFREKIIERYGQCIISGDDPMVCEACHIVPYNKCNEAEKYDVDNGLLLNRNLHKLFDDNELKINQNTLQIELSDNILNNNKMKGYIKYKNMKININDRSIYFLKKRYLV